MAKGFGVDGNSGAGAARNARAGRGKKVGRPRAAKPLWNERGGFRYIKVPAGKTVVVAVDPVVPEAKRAILECMLGGYSIGQSLVAVGRSQTTYEKWRREDKEFAEQANSIRLRGSSSMFSVQVAQAHERQEKVRSVSYADFAQKYLNQRVFPHTANVIDMIEGRPPGWLHPSMTYEPGERDLIVVNMPPEHAKTTAVTINYVVHQIVRDPSIRVLIVSKGQSMARKMLLAVKNRLTSPQYHKLIAEFAPPGGFDTDADGWSADMIYLGGGLRDAEQKDPTVQALGIKGHIYGARADLIIMDDCVDLTNAHDYEKQIEWIQSEVVSRLSSNGTLLLVGTRLAPRDLYSEIVNPDLYPEGVSPWTRLAMPAVLEFADDPADWVTLWPRSDRPERGDETHFDGDGLFVKWDGPRLSKKRARLAASSWARVYQQQQTTDDTVFSPDDVAGCTRGNRLAGRIPKGMPGNRPGGMDGLVVVAGLDPATTGHTAMVVIGVDVPAGKRYVLDVRNRPGMKPDELRAQMFDLTDHYQVLEWVVETNGFQGFLAHDREVNQYMSSRGCIVRPHFTGQIKRDPDFGVAAMAGLFNGWQSGDNLIELPSSVNSEGVKALVEQLCTWAPSIRKRQKTDTVMALWMAELAAMRRIEAHNVFGRRHQTSQFQTSWDRRQQSVFDLTEIEMAMRG